MPDDPLASVRLKVDRAEFHRKTFERELVNFFIQEPERAVAQLDEQGVYGLALIEPLPPHLSCIISDAVQNLRSAFDHFVWACALRFRDDPPRQIDFRVCKDGGDWGNYVGSAKGKQTRKAVGDDAWAVIEEMQPHTRGIEDPNQDPLWGMNELARIDRHQTLHLAVVEHHGTFVGFGPRPQRGNVLLWNMGEDMPRFATPMLENDPQMNRWTVSDAGWVGEVDTYSQLSFEVVFDPKGKVAQGWSVSRELRALVSSMYLGFVPQMEQVFPSSGITLFM